MFRKNLAELSELQIKHAKVNKNIFIKYYQQLFFFIL